MMIRSEISNDIEQYLVSVTNEQNNRSNSKETVCLKC